MTKFSSRQVLASVIVVLLSPTDALAPPVLADRRGWLSRSSMSTPHGMRFMSPSDIVDVEFEPINEETPPVPKGSDTSVTSNTSDKSSKTLLDISLESDPELTNLKIPFVDPDGRSFIDCKLTFMVDLDGVNYGIGIPYEHSAAISFQKSDGTMSYLSPDDDDNEELMQMMAGELKKGLDESLSLKRTPRVLTISGDLEKYTEGWQEKMFETVDTETLMDDDGEDMDFFLDFMKKELGEEEYKKTMQEEPEISDELLKMFDMPGLGDQKDDVDGLEKMLENMYTEKPGEAFDSLGKDLSHEGVALKLIGFNFKDGKAYNLVKMLKPFTLVAKQVSEEEGDIKFELLTSEEGKIVYPRLNEVCEEELREAGLTLL